MSSPLQCPLRQWSLWPTTVLPSMIGDEVFAGEYTGSGSEMKPRSAGTFA